MTAATPNADGEGKEQDDVGHPALATAYFDIQQRPFELRAVEDGDTQGRAEVDVEVWAGSHHSEPAIYLHGSGELASAGEYRAGFKMTFLQARHLRDRLDDALAQFGDER